MKYGVTTYTKGSVPSEPPAQFNTLEEAISFMDNVCELLTAFGLVMSCSLDKGTPAAGYYEVHCHGDDGETTEVFELLGPDELELEKQRFPAELIAAYYEH